MGKITVSPKGCFLLLSEQHIGIGILWSTWWSRDRLKAIGKRGMAQLCKDRDYAVLHTAVTRKNGLLLEKRKGWQNGMLCYISGYGKISPLFRGWEWLQSLKEQYRSSARRNVGAA